jgi:hypothetical protein
MSVLMRPIILVALLLVTVLAGHDARADGAAAQACAAKLPKDAQAIFGAALPKLAPGTDLRDMVTATTRQLVMDGKIDRDNARPSAMSAAKCLRLAGS